MARKTFLVWTVGNDKLQKTSAAGDGVRVVGFGLPALDACPFKGSCASVCYATQGRYTMPSVADARAENYAAVLSNRESIAEILSDDLAILRPSIVRIHDSGDFFAGWYLDAWITVAKRHPSIVFYAYTKAIPLYLQRAALVPANLRIVQSMGGTHDHLIDTARPHSRIFADAGERTAAGYDNGNDSDWPAINGTQRIGLVYHGTRKLTDDTRRKLAVLA